MRWTLLAPMLHCLVAAGHADAQTFSDYSSELGGTVGTACLTSSSACGGGQEPIQAAYGSYWLTPRVEVGARFARLTRPDDSGTTSYYLGPTNEEVILPTTARNRSRAYLLAQVYRHFGPDHRLRFFAGTAVGAQTDQATVSCDVPDCDERLTRIGITLRTGRVIRRRTIVAPGVGMGGHLDRLSWRAGLNLLALGGENVGATELFAGAGVRF